MIDDKIYFSVQAWMVIKLNLKGCERDVYAIIYGYSQDGESDYHGSLGYMAELTGYSKNSICTALKNLTDKQLILKTEKEINNIKFCRYQINCDGIQLTCMPIQPTCTNNNSNNNINNKKVLSKDNTTEFSFGGLKPKKDSLYTKCVALINDYTTDPDLHKALLDYLRVRLEVKDKPLYVNSWKGLLNKLDREFDASQRLVVVRQSIERGYLSFYPVSSYSGGLRNESGTRNVPSMTEDDYKREAEHLAELEARGVQVRF